MSRGSRGNTLKGLVAAITVCLLLGLGFVMMVVGSLPKFTGGCFMDIPGYDSSVPFITTSGPAANDYFSQFAPAEQADMKKNADTIIQVGRARNLSDRDIEIAIGTSIQEAHLHNLDHGDARSHGLFQQQWGMSWGTLEQTMDPVHASNAFYDALVQQPSRDTRSMRDVAEAVQRPLAGAYNRWAWDDVATEIVTGAKAQTGSINLASAEQTCKQPSLSADIGSYGHATGKYVVGDDYPYASAVIDSATPTGLARECVDFVTWRLNKQAGATQAIPKFSHIGNAVDWKAVLTSRGYVADNRPTIGAVAWFGAHAGDPRYAKARELGHVAIVSGVNEKEGTIIIEQYNGLDYPNDHQYGAITVPAHMPGVEYIHVADLPQLTPAMALSHG